MFCHRCDVPTHLQRTGFPPTSSLKPYERVPKPQGLPPHPPKVFKTLSPTGGLWWRRRTNRWLFWLDDERLGNFRQHQNQNGTLRFSWAKDENLPHRAPRCHRCVYGVGQYPRIHNKVPGKVKHRPKEKVLRLDFVRFGLQEHVHWRCITTRSIKRLNWRGDTKGHEWSRPRTRFQDLLGKD